MGATKPTVAVVAPDDPAVREAIALWSVAASPVKLVLASSCAGQQHCIVLNYDGLYFERSGNYGTTSNVGDAIRGTAYTTVALLQTRLLAHEFGHGLGLQHTSTDPKSICYIGGAGPYTGNNAPDRSDYRNAKAAWGSTP